LQPKLKLLFFRIGKFLKAINEVSYGLGFTLGPPMGSALYEIGGYALPLYVVGFAQLLVVLLSLPLHRSGMGQGVITDNTIPLHQIIRQNSMQIPKEAK
jgi:hypothetical protein